MYMVQSIQIYLISITTQKELLPEAAVAKFTTVQIEGDKKFKERTSIIF